MKTDELARELAEVNAKMAQTMAAYVRAHSSGEAERAKQLLEEFERLQERALALGKLMLLNPVEPPEGSPLLHPVKITKGSA